MKFSIFSGILLSLTLMATAVTAVEVDAPKWSASTPTMAAEQKSPLQKEVAPESPPTVLSPSRPDAEQPAQLPPILKAKSEPPKQLPLNQPVEETIRKPSQAEGPSTNLRSLADGKASLHEDEKTPLQEIAREASPEVSEPSSPVANTQAANTQAANTRAIATPRELPITSSDLEQLIQGSIAAPQHDNRISGRPLRLLDVLSQPVVLQQPVPRTRQPPARQGGISLLGGQLAPNTQATFTRAMLYKDPQQEQERILAYWELAQSLGHYHLFRQIADFWESTSALSGDEVLLRTARASAKSLLCEARVTLVTDQYTLVEIADLIPEEGLPLPSDPPHVGTYFTHFDKLFAGKPAPALGYRLNATLPLCREAVESRACSTLAAGNAVELLAKEYASGRCTFIKLASAVDRWQEEHHAFLRATYVYNHDICEYVVSVAGLPADRETLVMMLIRPTYSLTPQTAQTPLQSDVQSPTMTQSSTMTPSNGLSPAVARPEATAPVTARTLPAGVPIISNRNNYYQAPQYSSQTPTLAPPRKDRAVKPASAELPVLESTPTTTPVR